MRLLIIESTIVPELLDKGLGDIGRNGNPLLIDKADSINDITKFVNEKCYDCIVADPILVSSDSLYQIKIDSKYNARTPVVIFSDKTNTSGFMRYVFDMVERKGETKSYRQLIWAIAAAAHYIHDKRSGRVQLV